MIDVDWDKSTVIKNGEFGISCSLNVIIIYLNIKNYFVFFLSNIYFIFSINTRIKNTIICSINIFTKFNSTLKIEYKFKNKKI
jgi:hypothetical protein